MDRSMTLNLKPYENEIHGVTEKSSRFLKSHGFSNETIQSQLTVIEELIKNGLSYGKFNPSAKMMVKIQLEANAITVEVSSPVGKSACNRLIELDKMIQWMRGYQDPYEAYLKKLNENSNRSPDEKSNGLGLVKAAYEGKAILDFVVNEDNILNVSAVRYLED